MFHPTSNRLAGFLEISALFIALAQSGGVQYKAGFLRIDAEGHGPGFGRKSARWRKRKESRWCAVRESYIVVLEDPGEVRPVLIHCQPFHNESFVQLAVWDVFLFDTDFKIIRPTRYYRKGLQLLRSEPEDREFLTGDVSERQLHPETEVDCLSVMSSIGSRLSRVLRFGNRSSPNLAVPTIGETQGNEDALRPVHTRSETMSSISSTASSRPATPMLDPSTNLNPLMGSGNAEGGVITGEHEKKKTRKKRSDEVSKHTFYVENSQMRLKMFAKNEVGFLICSDYTLLTRYGHWFSDKCCSGLLL
jgi:phospholipase D1/2